MAAMLNHRSPKSNIGKYGELWLTYKSLFGDLKSINVWVIYWVKTHDHSMVSFFLILES